LACIARELTKHYEEVQQAPLSVLVEWLQKHPERVRGEFVIIIAADQLDPDPVSQEAQRILQLLLAELPLKRAVALAATISGAPKNPLYTLALTWQNN